jgi:hypothetical protein
MSVRRRPCTRLRRNHIVSARFLLASCSFVALLGCPRHSQSGSDASLATPAVQVTADWKTFQDERIGVAFRHPPTWTTTTTVRGPDRLPFALLDAPPTEFGGAKAGVTFVATSSERGLRACSVSKEPSKKIGGVDFFGAEFSSKAANGALFQRSMHALREGYCYEIAMYAANLNTNGHPTLNDESIRRFNATSEAILGTVQFIPRVAAGSDAGTSGH